MHPPLHLPNSSIRGPSINFLLNAKTRPEKGGWDLPNKPPASKRKSQIGRPPGARTKVRGSVKDALQKAAELFLTDPVFYTDPFARLKRNRAAAAAGHSSTTLYEMSGDEWRDTLANYLLDRTDLFREEFEEIQKTVRETEGAELIEAVARTATTDLETLSDNPAWNAMEVLAVCVAPRSEDVAATARKCYRELDAATWEDIYGQLMKREGRVPRKPFSPQAIGAVLQALVEGAGIRHLFDPEFFLEPNRLIGSERYGSYAVVVAVLLAILTCPDDGSDSRSVEDLVNEVLAGRA